MQGGVIVSANPSVVDVVFDIEGTSLPADYATALLRALAAPLPWLPTEARIGVHPLRGASTGYGVLLLAQRAKLVLRTPHARLEDMLRLAGSELDVADSRLRVGKGRPRPLAASTTLHAQQVASETADEQTFQHEVARWLSNLDVDCRFITGRRRTARADARAIAGFSVALHGLRAEDSLHVQAEGMGSDRCLGWGIFVPAKAIVASE
jgi:CRISPR-associated protein Cas6